MLEYDAVNHPKHYKETSLECIETMTIAFGANEIANYCCVNAYKYLFRYRTKNGLEDLKKANWYLDKCHELCVEYTEAFPKQYNELVRILNSHIEKWEKEHEG